MSVVSIGGVRAVVKRRAPGLGRGLAYVLRYARATLLALVCRIFLGEFPRPGVLLRNGLPYEAARLRHLREAGWRVPDVWWQEPGMLVLEYVGTDLRSFLRRCDEPGLRRWVSEAARELAAFHGRGFWHGGAQLRNLTVQDGCLWRIDFEENVGAALSLPMAQAYDVFQTLSSIHALRRVPEALMPELGALALDTYLRARPDPAVRTALRRMARLACGAARLARPLARRVAWRDLRAFVRLADTLRLLLHP